VWSSSCEACHNRLGATEGAMQVWIPFSPVQHVDCGCLVPERNGPRRRHRDTARPSTSAARLVPRALDACAHAFVVIGIISLSICISCTSVWVSSGVASIKCDTDRNFSEICLKYVGRRFRIVSEECKSRAARLAGRMQIARATRARDITNCVDDYLVPRRAVSGPKAARRTRTAPGR